MGINAPAVVGGSAEVDGRPVIRRPIVIKMGLQLEQIIEVNQPLELFSVVALLRMQWRDPDLAFNPDGTRLAVAMAGEGVIRVFAVELDDLVRIATTRLTRSFTETECRLYDIDPCPTLAEVWARAG